MHFNLISNLHNGVGLERDCQILAERLEVSGHTSRGLQFDQGTVPADAAADVNIFGEVLRPEFFKLAKRQWIIVNAEWFSAAWVNYLPQFEKVIVKTHHAFDLLRRLCRDDQLVYTGFEARDFYDPEVKRRPSFLHAAGKSRTKNTDQILEAWKIDGGLPDLTVVTSTLTSKPAGAAWQSRVDDTELARLMNENLFAIMPSSYEGFGHSIWESLGCGELLVTTNAEPMRSFGDHCPEGLVATSGIKNRNGWLADIHSVNAAGIREAVKRITALPVEKILEYSALSRAKFLSGRSEFRQRFAELVKA